MKNENIEEKIFNNAFNNKIFNKNYYSIYLDTDIFLHNILEFFFFESSIKIEKDTNLKLLTIEKNRFMNEIICYSCGEFGHVMKDCSLNNLKNCQWCDTYHKNDVCKLEFCENCKNIGHTEKYCKEKKQQFMLCELCLKKSRNKIFHDVRSCPLLWRKYKLKKPFQYNKIISCPLCFSSNHYLGDCKFLNEKFLIFSKDWDILCQFYYIDNNNIGNLRKK